MLPAIAQVLLTLHVFISLMSPRAVVQQVDALPITSKPIESTAENLAWQAWIMMPPHEQNLEKSRKVTPKSIFLLPNRIKPNGQAWTVEAESGSGIYAPIDCPPGQQQFESRCISTLDIDREQLLIQELQILLQHGGNNNNQNAYDYDYDYDEESVAAVEANYKAPMMFKGDELASGSVSGNYDDAVRLPNEDAPLKFNIFSDNYPTDLEAPHKQLNTMEMANVNSSNPWSLSQSIAFAQVSNATSTLSGVNEKPTEVMHRLAATISSSTTTAKTAPTNEGFPIMGIDAIVLPAEATSSQLQKFSFFKDDSGVQLVSTVATSQNGGNIEGLEEQSQESHTQLTDLLKFDSLLPLNSSMVAPLVAPTTDATTKTTLATTATLKATTLAAPRTSSTTSTTTTKRTTAANLMTVTSSKTTRTVGVDFNPTPATTTIVPKQTDALLAADDRVTQQELQEKEEHTRSVTLPVSASAAPTASTRANEPETTINHLTSTLQPTTTSTSINANNEQLDETTIIEMLLEAADVERQGSVLAQALQKLKKMKVKPVDDKTMAITDDDDLFVNRTTPLPTLHTLQNAQQKVVNHNNVHHDDDDHDDDPDLDDDADDDRFSYQPVDGVETTVADDVNVDASGQHEVGASTLSQLVPDKSTTTIEQATKRTKSATTTRTTSSSTINSEIDVAAELRAINELVKQNNRRQGAINKKTTAAAKATMKNDLTTTTNTKAISKLKSIEQQLAKATTENGVDFESNASTSASSETTATTTIEVNAAMNAKAIAAATVVSATTTTVAPTTVTVAPTTATVAAITTPASTLVTADEDTATATLWAKILPLLGYGFTTTTITPDLPASATSPATTQTSSSKSSLSSTNRSLRNSKITRIDKLNTNSLRDNTKKTTTTEAMTTTTKRISNGLRSKAYVVPLFQPTESTELPISTTTAKPKSAAGVSDGSFSPFWWLPAGWRLDRPFTTTPSSSSSRTTSFNKKTEDAATAEPSLLLRFWSAFPGNQVKVKE